jgi:hypothetical protein
MRRNKVPNGSQRWQPLSTLLSNIRARNTTMPMYFTEDCTEKSVLTGRRLKDKQTAQRFTLLQPHMQMENTSLP